MAFYLLSADRRDSFSYACIEQSEIFVNFSTGAHGGTWVTGNNFLLDGDGRWQSLDEVTFWFAHSPQKLSGV